jgi:hypothetical protein
MSEIFAKKEQKREEIDFKAVLKTIPTSATENPDEQLAQTFVELRWRFFCIPYEEIHENDYRINPEDNQYEEFVEISRKYPNKERECVADYKYKKINVDPFFDKYVTKQFYYYIKK